MQNLSHRQIRLYKIMLCFSKGPNYPILGGLIFNMPFGWIIKTRDKNEVTLCHFPNMTL